MDWNKIGAIAGIATTILTAAMLYLMLWPPSESEGHSMVAVPILVGACIVVGGFFNLKAALIHLRKKPAVPAALSDSASLRTLGVRLLRDDFGYLLEHYRRLEFDAHDKVKFPLAGC